MTIMLLITVMLELHSVSFKMEQMLMYITQARQEQLQTSTSLIPQGQQALVSNVFRQI